MSVKISARLRKLVRERAQGRCEYCLRHEDDSTLHHQPDHITSRKHRGGTNADNLAWSWAVCNLLKGSEVAAIDSETGQPARFFNPRVDRCGDHFRLENGLILGVTAEGRVTEQLLQFNREDLIELRRTLIRLGRFP